MENQDAVMEKVNVKKLETSYEINDGKCAIKVKVNEQNGTLTVLPIDRDNFLFKNSDPAMVERIGNLIAASATLVKKETAGVMF